MKTSLTLPPLCSITLSVLSCLAVVAWATPVVPVHNNGIRLPIAKRFNFTGSAKILEQDQARVQHLRTRADARIIDQGLPPNLGNSSVFGKNRGTDYAVNLSIGTPPTIYQLVLDTGSANTWVGAGSTTFRQTSTTRQTRDRVTVNYASGAGMSGVEFTDSVQLTNALPIAGQSIGVASEHTGFDPVINGVLGIGPAGLSVGTLSPDATSSIPTITDNLFSQGVIAQNLVAIFFQPALTTGVDGELTFGATDATRFVGTISFAPITSTSPASQFFGISQSVRYGASTKLLNNAPGIFDTGTTLVLLATDVLATYINAVGAVFDTTTQLYRITPAQYANLSSLFFTINGVVFEFTANAQIWPRTFNLVIGGDEDSIYLIVGDSGTHSGSGLDFINGMAFIERFYTVFDTENNRVGVANTEFTRATTN
ncbi:hypothetical protein VTO73DRAFT_2787 [Trametes versicolor]